MILLVLNNKSSCIEIKAQKAWNTITKWNKDLQIWVATIKQTTEKILDKDTSLAERICTLFREQDTTILSVLTALPMTISTIEVSVTCVFGGGGGSAADALKRLTVKAIEAFVTSVVGVMYVFLDNAVGLVAELAWVFAAALFAIWLTQILKKIFIYLFIYLFLFVYLFVYLFIYLFIYPLYLQLITIRVTYWLKST